MKFRATIFGAVCVLAASLGTGCGPKEAVTTPAAPGSAAGGAPAAAVKVTPEQEAARQNAIKQGPAIEAALKRQGQ